MSGGVDSLRAAALLQEQGNDVFAVHMRLSPPSGWQLNGGEDADLRNREQNLKYLTALLGIPLTIVDMQDVFTEKVILPFIDAYRNGLTPNPCVICNPIVKFGYLLQEARKLGADQLATGHYVQKKAAADRGASYQLHRGKDPGKDQSYFLYGLTQQQLSLASFPLGDLTKSQVIGWAQQKGFWSLLPAESQELCFVLAGTYQEFLLRNGAPDLFAGPGPIVDSDGNYLGRHKGIFSYTIGQRRGLGITSTEPYYVIDLDPESNTVRVGRSEDLFRTQCAVGAVNWLSIASPHENLRANVRIRNQHRPAPAWLIPDEARRCVLVRFDSPQRAVTPGQAAVFYSGDLVLGGGTILKSPCQ